MIKIRQAALQDFDAIQELNQIAFSKNPDYDQDIILDFALTQAGERYFKDAIQNTEGCFLVAEEGEKLIGYVNGEEIELSYRKGKYFEVANLGVLPEYRRQGLGERLLEEISVWAKEHGFNRMYLSCYSKNDEALKFYRKIGYQTFSVEMEKTI